MTSQINPNNIDGNYPTAGVSNNTQGMRDNFTNIKQNFQYAEDELNDLQSKAVLKAALTGTTLDNNMNDNLIYAAKLQDLSWTYVQNTATAGSITLDYSAGQYQQINPSGPVSLAFTNFPAAGSAGLMFFVFNVTNVSQTLTLPATVNRGIETIAGSNPGTAGVTNTITFGAVGYYAFQFVTTDGGTNIYIFDDVRPPDVFTANLTIANSSVSISTTTGALVVQGGTGIQGNLNVGGNLKTYTSSGNVAFQALDTGFIQINSPVVPANTAGALNIVGSGDGSYQPVYNSGSMVHVTGNDGVSNRITLDTFGTGAAIQTSLVMRLARGTAAAPTAVQANDILARITGSGFGNASQYVLAAGNIGTLGVDFVALENYTAANAGSALKFYTSPIGAVSKTLSANVTANVSTFPAVSATGNITGGNVNTGILSLSGNVIGNLNVTSNIAGGNILTVGLVSSTGNVTGGNIVTGGQISSTGNITTPGNILLSAGGTMGYTTGAGGTVAQTGNKSGNVTLNKPAGEITMQNTNLAAATTVDFYLTNNTITATDLLIINQTSTANAGGYVFNAKCNAGNAQIFVRNVMASTAGDAVVLRYAVVKGATT